MKDILKETERKSDEIKFEQLFNLLHRMREEIGEIKHVVRWLEKETRLNKNNSEIKELKYKLKHLEDESIEISHVDIWR